MKGWQIHEYGGIELLQCNEHIKIPTINSPTDVLVEVRAASVNPIDVAMMGTFSPIERNLLFEAIECRFVNLQADMVQLY